MSKSLEWELQWIDDHPEFYEGPMHREAVKRFITTRYNDSKLIKGVVRYVETNKTYQYLGQSIGAGWRRDERLFVYRDDKSGQIFHREPKDFKERMR